MHKLAVFGSPLVAGPLSEYLTVIGYDVSIYPTQELRGFQEASADERTVPVAEMVIVDLPALDPERGAALSALRALRSMHGVPGVLLLDGLGDCLGSREPEVLLSAAAVLAKPLRLGTLAAVCSRVLMAVN